MENSPLIEAARAIVRARDYKAEHGVYDPADFHPDSDQAFDDWAADILETALDAAKDQPDFPLLARSRFWLTMLCNAEDIDPAETEVKISVQTKDGQPAPTQPALDTVKLGDHFAALDAVLGRNPLAHMLED